MSQPDYPYWHGPWQVLSSVERYRDPWVALRRDEVVRPDGALGSYVVVHLKPGVSVLALDQDDYVYLTEEFHYGVGRVTLEVASGGIEEGEQALETAQRELQEELGLIADEWIDLGMCDPFTASVVSPTQLYLARGLTIGSQALEGTELIRSVRLSFSTALDLVMSGEITHACSCLAILKTAHLLGIR